MSRKYNEELAMFDNSEVFHEFMKLAYDSGLSSYEDVEIGKDPDSEKQKLIESLYSNEATEDQDKNGEELIEKAHEDEFEVAKTYLDDAGEYKNSIKTHKIMEDVATKGPDLPNNIWHKNVTAITNLMNELIVIAEEMEVRDQKDLVSFADSILQGIDYTGDMVKQALNPKGWNTFGKLMLKALMLGGVVGTGAFLALSHVDPKMIVKNVATACDIYLQAINNYVTNKEGLDQFVKAQLQEQKESITEFKNQYVSELNDFDSLVMDRDLEKAKEVNNSISKLVSQMTSYIDSVFAELERIKEVESDVASFTGATDSMDVATENLSSLYRAITVSDEAELIRNLGILKQTLEKDQKVRADKLTQTRSTPPSFKKELDEDTIEV